MYFKQKQDRKNVNGTRDPSPPTSWQIPLFFLYFFEPFPQADSHAGEVGVLTEDGDPIVALSSAVAGIDSKLRAREVWRLLVLGKPRHAHNNHQERS